jgi:hypothetical protein
MDCLKVISSTSRGNNENEFWEDVLYKCDTVTHIKKVEGQPPYTDMFRVVIEGVEAVYLVELPRW